MSPSYSQTVEVRRPGLESQYQAPSMRMGRSAFPLTHQHKTSFNASELIPYFVCEVIPGDTFTCRVLAFARVFSPLDAPVMDNIELGLDFFFAPNRILWENWKAFLGAHDQAGAQDTDYTVPKLSGGSVFDDSTSGERLGRFMGIPWGADTTAEVIQALPFRAYNMIYNEWYRDQNIIDEETFIIDDGPDPLGRFEVWKSAKKPDYFTTALPYLQKGDIPNIALTDAPVTTDSVPTQNVAVKLTQPPYTGAYHWLDHDSTQVNVSGTTGTEPFRLYADLSNVGLSINALREAAGIQRMLELDARAGTRYPEKIRTHFGVDVPDYTTQRPEYLGGGTGYINISPVANTSATATEDQGQLAGTAAGTITCSWAKSFVEHGWVIGILRARGEVTYQQGLDRMWSRQTLYEYLWPQLVHLGEQPIYKKELFLTGTSTDDEVFGYQERYAEYRFKKSLCTGLFASDATGSLDFWHLAEDFAAQPTLNRTFIEDQTPMARVTTVDTSDDFVIDGRFDLRVARALPVRPVPSLIAPRF